MKLCECTEVHWGECYTQNVGLEILVYLLLCVWKIIYFVALRALSLCNFIPNPLVGVNLFTLFSYGVVTKLNTTI